MNNQPLRQLLDSTLKDNANYQKEIERLNKESEQLRTALNSKESIIKEVREYIENTYQDYKNEDGSLPLTLHDQDLLEILDKEKK